MHAHRARPADDSIRAGRRPRQRRPTSGSTRRRSVRSAPRPSYWAPDDLRRLIAAALSAVFPGLGQALNRRRRLAQWLALPVALLAVIGAILFATNSPTRLFASIVAPSTMAMLLGLNLVIFAWRGVAVVQAFFDGRFDRRSGRAGAAGLAILLLAVATPHLVVNAWGTQAQATFAKVFAGDHREGPGQVVAATGSGPGANDRLNVLIVGIDKTPWRTATLTDSLMVASLDPVGQTATLVSLPRDLVRVPLGDGNVFGPKINSLMSYADRHPDQFPQGGMRALEDAVGALLGIHIDYYAQVDFFGFVKLVDAVGGVDINVTRAWYDPKYDGLGVNPSGVHGWGVEVGPHHFDGWEALAYARSRQAPTESDFTRAARQQEILVALRNKVLGEGSLLTNLPGLLDALGNLVTTDLPTDRLPTLAAIADEMGPGSIVKVVLKKPLVNTGGIDPVLGSIQVPDVAAIQAVAKTLFPAPGTPPQPWPTPVPTATPRATATPAGTEPPSDAATAPPAGT